MQNVELAAIEILFDELSDVAFFVKDRAGRYLAANRTLVRRCGLRTKQEIVGKTVMEVHPRHLAQTYMAQDREVIEAGSTIKKHLELHLYPNRCHGWCLTHKTPLRDAAGAIVGLVGTSHDLGHGRRAGLGAAGDHAGAVWRVPQVRQGRAEPGLTGEPPP